MLDAFLYTDSRPDSLVYTRQNLENLFAEFRGHDGTESVKSMLRTYDHISRVLTERGMMVKYERTEMSLCALPKRLWRKVILKLGLNPLDPCMFDYGKLKDWITSKIFAAEAVAMFEFLTPTAALMTINARTAPPTSPASIYSINPTALATSLASTTSPASALASPAPFAPAAAETTTTIPMAAKVPSTTAMITTLPSARSSAARQGTISAGPTVRLGMIRFEPPPGSPVRRHRFVQPKDRQESGLPNHQVTDQQHRPQPTSLFNQRPAPLPSHQDAVQPPRQRDVLSCHSSSGQHHLRACVNLRTDLEDGVVCINNRDRPVLGRAGQEIPMTLAAHSDRTMRDFARAGPPVRSTLPPPQSPSQARSNSQPLPTSSSLTSPPSPPARPVSPAPSPARPTRPSAPLLSTEQLTQQMKQVMEHFARSQKVDVDEQPRPRYTACPPLAIRLERMQEQSRSQGLLLGRA